MSDKELEEGDVQGGEINNYEMLAAMLKEQMSMVYTQGELQQKQAEEIQRVIRGLGGQIVRLDNRVGSLEERLEVECRQVSSLKDKFQNNTELLNPVDFELKISHLESRVNQLEEAVQVSVWTEDKMAELVTSVYADMRTELWEDLEKRIAERVNTEMAAVLDRSRNASARPRVSGMNAASTPCNYKSTETALMVGSTIEKKNPDAKQASALTTDKDELSGEKYKSVLRPNTTQCRGSYLGANTGITQMKNSRPVQKPMSFDGTTLWDAYYAQFEIIAQVNGWDEQEKSAFLASSLKGQALLVLGNLKPEDRRDFKCLVTALSNRFGSAHQTELSRVRFKNRVKQRDESLPELSQEIERLARLSYPEASSTLQDVLARDQFIDALPDEETRLKLKHERPKTLQEALTLALEFESFYLAARQQRARLAREVQLVSSPEMEVPRQNGKGSGSERLNEGNEQLVQVISRLEASMHRCLTGIQAAFEGSQRRRKSSGCWHCEGKDHIRKDCPLLKSSDDDADNGVKSRKSGNGN